MKRSAISAFTIIALVLISTIIILLVVSKFLSTSPTFDKSTARLGGKIINKLLDHPIFSHIVGGEDTGRKLYYAFYTPKVYIYGKENDPDWWKKSKYCEFMVKRLSDDLKQYLTDNELIPPDCDNLQEWLEKGGVERKIKYFHVLTNFLNAYHVGKLYNDYVGEKTLETLGADIFMGGVCFRYPNIDEMFLQKTVKVYEYTGASSGLFTCVKNDFSDAYTRILTKGDKFAVIINDTDPEGLTYLTDCRDDSGVDFPKAYCREASCTGIFFCDAKDCVAFWGPGFVTKDRLFCYQKPLQLEFNSNVEVIAFLDPPERKMTSSYCFSEWATLGENLLKEKEKISLKIQDLKGKNLKEMNSKFEKFIEKTAMIPLPYISEVGMNVFLANTKYKDVRGKTLYMCDSTNVFGDFKGLVTEEIEYDDDGLNKYDILKSFENNDRNVKSSCYKGSQRIHFAHEYSASKIKIILRSNGLIEEKEYFPMEIGIYTYSFYPTVEGINPRYMCIFYGVDDVDSVGNDQNRILLHTGYIDSSFPFIKLKEAIEKIFMEKNDFGTVESPSFRVYIFYKE